ncbi:hypothetical protein [Streptomyces sp. NPDC056361]|uniref:hypothetical protein n=1 Tax=Streptomyces sp. NPDC056361 TaxID=3345795 RepID=UPI0035D8B526
MIAKDRTWLARAAIFEQLVETVLSRGCSDSLSVCGRRRIHPATERGDGGRTATGRGDVRLRAFATLAVITSTSVAPQQPAGSARGEKAPSALAGPVPCCEATDDVPRVLLGEDPDEAPDTNSEPE